MGRILFLIFLIVPIIEIGIFIVIGQAIGLLLTLGGVVVTALLGSFIIRYQGLSLISEIQALMKAGALPARQLVDGVMLAIAGALLLTPGYFTDFLGFLLLVPMVRGAIYLELKKRVTIAPGFTSSSGFTSSTNGEGGGGYSGSDTGYSSEAGEHNQNGDPDVVDLKRDDWR